MTRRSFLLIAVLVGLAARATAAPAADPAKGKADEFFGLTKVYTLHLTIAAADFQKMPPPSGRGGRGFRPFMDDSGYPKVPAHLEFEGKDWGEITVRYKGNSSFRSAPTELKRSLKLDFDTSDKGPRFFGLSKLNLNNNAFDSSQMREALGYDVFRRAGVPAPRTAFAKVFVTVPGTYTHEYAGLFTVIEEIDQTFFKERWGSKVGVLVKPEGLRGMPYLDTTWAAYGRPYGEKGTAKPEDAARFMAFVKFLNQASDEEFARGIGDYLDVEEFLHFLAAEVVLVNTDSPLAMNHNYWVTIHPETKKVVWLPWDLNMAFGGFMSGDYNLSIYQASAKGVFPLADRLLANKDVADRYHQILRQMATSNFTVNRLGTEMAAIATAIRAAVAADGTLSLTNFERNLADDPFAIPDAGGSAGFFGRGRNGPPLKAFVSGRVESVIEQLDGKRAGTPGRSGRGGFGGGPQFPQ